MDDISLYVGAGLGLFVASILFVFAVLICHAHCHLDEEPIPSATAPITVRVVPTTPAPPADSLPGGSACCPEPLQVPQDIWLINAAVCILLAVAALCSALNVCAPLIFEGDACLETYVTASGAYVVSLYGIKWAYVRFGENYFSLSELHEGLRPDGPDQRQTQTTGNWVRTVLILFLVAFLIGLNESGSASQTESGHCHNRVHSGVLVAALLMLAVDAVYFASFTRKVWRCQLPAHIPKLPVVYGVVSCAAAMLCCAVDAGFNLAFMDDPQWAFALSMLFMADCLVVGVCNFLMLKTTIRESRDVFLAINAMMRLL